MRDTIFKLVNDLHLPTTNDQEALTYHLIRQHQILDGNLTLLEVQVQEGDILQLTLLDRNATVGNTVTGAVLARMGGKAGGAPLPISAALFDSAGRRYDLRHSRALIGRADTKLGYPPESLDADLTEVDPGKTVSRPHALIVFNNGEFTIRDLYSQRGLMLNGERVSPSKAAMLQDGDSLTLGDVSVQFRCET
ncbi:MAG: FHA domain-containing protein [Chloroflexota bacterium]